MGNRTGSTTSGTTVYGRQGPSPAVRRLVREHGAVLALILLVVACSAVSRSFLTLLNASNLARQSCIVGILALAEGLLLMSGGIDVSVGSLVVLASVLSAMYARASILLGILIALGACGLLGLVNGIVVTSTRLAPFLATLPMMGIARGLALAITHGDAVTGVPRAFTVIANGYVGPVPVPGLILVGLFVAWGGVLQYLPFGRHIYAAGGDESAAILSGIPVVRVRLILYLVAGLSAGLAGVVYTARVGTGMPVGVEGYEMNAIAAAVIGGVKLEGGRGRLSGVFAGVLVVTIISNIMNLAGVSPYVQGAVHGCIILAALMLTSF